MKKTRSLLLAAATLYLVGYPLPSASAHPHHAGPEFVFTPPSRSPKFPDMVIGILTPTASGSFFANQTESPADNNQIHSGVTNKILDAAETDLKKSIIAKGFRCAGIKLSRANLSDDRKAQMSLLLQPQFRLDLTEDTGHQAQAQITGEVTLLFTEPETGARIWSKTVPLAPFVLTSQEVHPGLSADQYPHRVLTAFYQSMMRQVWDQINPLYLRTLDMKLVGD